ncbi:MULTISPECIES: hypothetical protein [Sphingobacterium]|uniref:hypothetical protein n=1 Tax=Sphingobacterium TaxID=28453 RepID=UPI001113051E|nr:MULTISPECIES: hypothetical protein [Sphingobacterium]
MMRSIPSMTKSWGLFGKCKEQAYSDRMQSMLRCFPNVDRERKRTGVSRHMLWLEYLKEFPDG